MESGINRERSKSLLVSSWRPDWPKSRKNLLANFTSSSLTNLRVQSAGTETLTKAMLKLRVPQNKIVEDDRDDDNIDAINEKRSNFFGVR